MVRCGRRLTVSLCVLTAAAAVAVTGKPHGRCSSPDDYATAFSAAYYLPGASGTAFGPPLWAAVDYAGAEAAAYRSGRSNGHDGPADGPVAVAATTDVVAALAPPAAPAPPAPLVQHAPGHSVKPTAAATSDPCKGPSPAPQAQAANDTASLTVEKLTAYYDRLKAQHETLARRQIEVQLLEQQQRRHREYALVQQQIQQQYYQQQQHALAMLDQLHKNPAFVSQMAAYMEQRLKANNGTANRTVAAAPAVPPAAVVPVAAVPPVVARARVAAKADEDDSDQDIVKNLDDDDDDKDDEDDEDDGDDKDDQACDGVPVKRVKPKQIAGRDRAGRIGARSTWKMDARDADDDRHRRRSDDDRIAEKIYGVDSE